MLDRYDEIRYPSLPRNQSHPAYISALAGIAGVQLPPVEGWRVLEIGCGDASNIIPLAADYPDGEFFGIDRAKETLESARTLAVNLQLKNLHLYPADLLDWKPDREFDYIIAHGVYSWVPPEVRERILQICGDHLKPTGVAFISYNAFPGCHFRRFAWDLLQFHIRRCEDPAIRIQKAREMAQLISSMPGEEPLQPAVRKEMETILQRDATALYHDDLAEINQPFYFLDFLSDAARHGLQYLGDAEPQRDDIHGQPSMAEDWLESRQYGDFLARRRFRESLLCRNGIPLDRKLELVRFRDLFAASRVKPAEIQENGQQRFELPVSGSLTTNHPFAKDLLCNLSAIWPGSLRLSELLRHDSDPDLAELLMRLLQAGALELRSSAPKIAACISGNPVTSALARAQLRAGWGMVTNQRHQNLKFQDEVGRRLLLLMDGTRNRADLARELALLVPDLVSAERSLDSTLLDFHRLNLLTG